MKQKRNEQDLDVQNINACELDDEQLDEVSGGVTSYVGGLATRNVGRYAPNAANVANSSNTSGQKKYTIDRIAGNVYSASPKKTNEQ